MAKGESQKLKIPFMLDLALIKKQNDIALKNVFKGKIKGYFLIDVKDRVMKALGVDDLFKFYDFCWSQEKSVTGIGAAAEYDICRMIVGIHNAKSIFLSKHDIRENEKSRKYKQELIDETIEKIKLRSYGSVHFRGKTLLQGEEFLYYPLPYELFVMTAKMSGILPDVHEYNWQQLYYGVIYNSISALSLMGDNLLGTAYPLCRGAIEMYFKLLILTSQTEFYDIYDKFRTFEVQYSCKRSYPEEFNALFKERICKVSKAKADFLHFGWVDYIDKYHKVVKKSPYSLYGIIAFLENENKDKKFELEWLGNFYKSCHAYTHGSIQTAKYPVLHYFEISIMLYFIIRKTFILLCGQQKEETIINGQDIISMIDRDFDILYNQYIIRSTENFDRYYNGVD